MTPTSDEAIDIVHTALACGVAGDMRRGRELLLPLMNGSPGAVWALFAMLAETACYIKRRDQAPGTVFTAVSDTEVESVDELSPAFRFAVQYAATWANGDDDTAEALLVAFLKTHGQHADQFATAAQVLYRMAVDTAVEIVAENGRAALTGEDTP